MAARIALHASDESTRLALVKAFEGSPSDWEVFLWAPDRHFDVLVGEPSDAGEGAVGFDASDPQRTVAAVAEALVDRKRRITVITGARRGSGVSTLALHLCAALADGMEVCLLDLDADSSLRERMDLPEESRHWGDASGGVLTAAVPVHPGFRILLSPRNAAGNASDAVRSATGRFDHVVVDAPAGPWRATALARCTSALLVVPPTRQGIAHAQRLVSLHSNARWVCVVNRLGAGGEITASDVSRGVERPVRIELPCSPYLRDREDDHALLVGRWSRYYRRVTRLAAALG